MYAIYLRKSRADADAEARGEGETLARHESALLHLAKIRNLSVGKIYREIVSGETISARPEMQQLLNDVEQGCWDGVLVMEVERLARGDTMDQGIVAQAFKYSNTLIITPNKTYDPNNEADEEYFEFGLFMSRREYKTINRRLQRGRETSINEGKFVGNKAPYGYRRKKLDHEKGYTLEIVPEEAQIVRLIFDWYAHGIDGSPVGCQKIVNRLHDMGLPSPTGAEWWSPATIKPMMRNPTYIGKIVWGRRAQKKQTQNGIISISRPRSEDYKCVNGLHEAIISEALWDDVQRKIEIMPETSCIRDRALQNSLAKVLYCGECGKSMTRRPYVRGKHQPVILCATKGCPTVSADYYAVERRILLSLSEWVEKYKSSWNETEEAKQADNESNSIIKNLEQEVKKLESQKSKLYDLLEQGVYDTATFLDRSKNLADRIDASKTRLITVQRKQDEMDRQRKAVESFIPSIEYVLEYYWTTEDPSARNQMLRSVIDRVEYHKLISGRWHSDPEAFEIILYPRLPK